LIARSSPKKKRNWFARLALRVNLGLLPVAVGAVSLIAARLLLGLVAVIYSGRMQGHEGMDAVFFILDGKASLGFFGYLIVFIAGLMIVMGLGSLITSPYFFLARQSPFVQYLCPRCGYRYNLGEAPDPNSGALCPGCKVPVRRGAI
jgi:hypothetical protein